MNAQNFLAEVRRLFRTAFAQKFIVILMRAAWVGGAVYIFCWGTHNLWGWFPHQERWVFYAAAVSILILASVLRHLRASRAFVWRVDRNFGFDEQLYTAFERVSQLGEGSEPDPGTRLLLESEAVSRFPRLRRQITGRSGQFRREIESTIVVLILLMIIYLAGIGSIDRIPLSIRLDFLPPVPSEPNAWDIFRSGIPGDETEPAEPEEQQAGEEPESQNVRFDPLCDPALNLDPGVWRQTQDLLSQLGGNLCCGSSTLVLSEALRFQNYAAAGDELSVMAGKIREYSPETRRLLSDRFLETSLQFSQINQADYSAKFAAAASALLDGTSGEMAEGLDELSILMRQFEAQQRCITIADWEAGGQLLPSSGEGGSADLPVYSGSVDFIPLEASASDASGTGTGDGTGLQSYEVPLEETDVVSSYFSPD